MYQGFGFVIANPALGMPPMLYDEGLGSRSTGKERDTESGNDYMFARYYNSATGRFLSPDWSAKVEPVPYAKLGDPQSLNLYSYVENNPLNRTDPTGHCGENAQAKPCKVKDIKMKATPSNPNMVQQDMDGKGGVGKVTGVRATITESIKVSGNPQVSVSEQNTTQNTRNGVIQPNQQQVQNTNSVTLQPGQQITDASSLVRATGGDPQVSQAIAQDYTNNAWTSSTNHSETLTLGNGQEFLAVTQRTLQNGAGGPTYTQSTTQPAVLSLGTPTPVEPIPTTYTGDIQ
jgi:RHS repeat-associated protein